MGSSTKTDFSRREFTQSALGTLLTYSLLETAFENDLWADNVKPVAKKWLTELNQLSESVKGQEIKQENWQKQIETLFSKVPFQELLQLLDFDRLAKGAKFVDNGARSLRFDFPKVEGLPTNYVFGKQIFALKKDRSVVPHGHNNMATAFLILKGDLHGRHYDRLEDHADHIIIKPTIDKKFAAGGYSTVSDFKDNVHWFKAISEPSFIFNIHVLGVRPNSKLPTGRVYVNPMGEKISGGRILAPRIGYKESHQLFG